MDYKKKYKEALEKAKRLYGEGTITECLCHIFPELEESEGEKIRKVLIRYHKSTIDLEGIKGEDIIAWLEKQGEQKFADKVDPKFHEGDWIISNNNKYIYQVVEVKRGIYVVRDNADNREYCVGIESADRDGRLWTILDAKDGDVLYSLDSKQPFIFKHRKPNEQAEVYCGINIYGKFFVENTKDCIITTDKYIPATKEQRDILEKAMADAGYEWSDKDRKLIKIVR